VIHYKPELVVQFVLPNYKGHGETQLNQIIGKITLQNSINEINILKGLQGYMELAGPLP
jgi:hypothetical protein